MRQLFNGTLTQDERIKAVARALDLSPSHPESWPRETIEALLQHCESIAADEFSRQVAILLGAGAR